MGQYARKSTRVSTQKNSAPRKLIRPDSAHGMSSVLINVPYYEKNGQNRFMPYFEIFQYVSKYFKFV